ncbi:MAG: hypothetical protein R3F62_26795 [Planctomycetota bacterium]
MTDHRRRLLERAVGAGSGVEGELALLRERMRVGAISTRDLELAAYCGSEAAAALTGVRPGPKELGAWVEQLPRADKPLCVRAGHALARALVTEHGWDDAWLEAFDDWLREPVDVQQRARVQVEIPEEEDTDVEGVCSLWSGLLWLLATERTASAQHVLVLCMQDYDRLFAGSGKRSALAAVRRNFRDLTLGLALDPDHGLA